MLLLILPLREYIFSIGIDNMEIAREQPNIGENQLELDDTTRRVIIEEVMPSKKLPSQELNEEFNDKGNIYLRMPIEQVRRDAKEGISLAVSAWRKREPDVADRFLGKVVEPGGEKKAYPESKQPSSGEMLEQVLENKKGDVEERDIPEEDMQEVREALSKNIDMNIIEGILG